MISGNHRSSDKPVQISVLIPTRERPQQLDACVKSVLASDHKSFEVIVIDQSPEPYALIRDRRLHIHHSPARGKSAALNVAMGLAYGHLFAFADDDCTVSQDWLKRGQERFEAQPEVDLIYGALLAIPHNRSLWFVPEFQRCAFPNISTLNERDDGLPAKFAARAALPDERLAASPVRKLRSAFG